MKKLLPHLFIYFLLLTSIATAQEKLKIYISADMVGASFRF